MCGDVKFLDIAPEMLSVEQHRTVVPRLVRPATVDAVPAARVFAIVFIFIFLAKRKLRESEREGSIPPAPTNASVLCDCLCRR